MSKDLCQEAKKDAKALIDNKTKAELVEIIKALDSALEISTSQLSARNAALSETGEAGWLITTPMAEYFGTFRGIRFEGGRAFIPAGIEDAALLVRECQDMGYEVREMNAKDFKALAVLAPPKKEKTLVEEIQTVSMANVGGEQ